VPYFHYTPAVRIYYEVHGSGRPVVFLHGFGASLETWRDIQDALASRFQVWLLDLKGFGRSDKPPDDGYRLSDHARAVRAFVGDQRLADAALVGHSYGGAVAVLGYLFLREQGEAPLPSSLVLINPAANDRPLPMFVKVLRIPVVNSAVLALVPAQARAALTLRGLFHNRSLVTPSRARRYAQFFDVPGAHHSFVTAARQVTSSEAARFRSRLGEVAAPTLIIWGRNDRALPISNAHFFHERIEGSTLEFVEACGHIPQEERPEECARLIVRFLNAPA